jgi:uncharacterized membrane protein YbhN (UPF0104 family)
VTPEDRETMTLDPPQPAAPPPPPRLGERIAGAPVLGGFVRYLGAIVSVIAVVGFVVWAAAQEPPKFPTAPEDLALVGVAMVLYAVVTLMRGWRWHRILRHNGIAHSRTDAYALCVVGYACNNVLPARGGELLRIFLMSQRTGARKREVLGTVVAERVLDAVSLAILFVAIAGAGVAGSSIRDSRTLVAFGALALTAVAFGVALMLHRRTRLQRVMAGVLPIARASRRLVSPFGALMLAFTIAVWMIEGVVLWLVGLSLGLDITPFEGMFVLVLCGFFVMIPAAPGYVGTFEAGVAIALRRLGISGGAAVAFALLVRGALYVPTTVVGLIILVVRYGGLGLLRSKRWRETRETGVASG